MHHEWDENLNEKLVEQLAQIDDALRQGAVEAAATVNPVLMEYLQDIRQELQSAWPSTRRDEVLHAGNDQDTQVDIPVLPSTVTRLGRFEIRSPLGGGGQGQVFLAFDPQLKREVAIKIPRLHTLFNPKQRRRFDREARLAANLKHPHIVALYDTGEEEGSTFLVSEYVNGPSLAEWLASLKDQPLAPRTAAEIVECLAQAVQYMHDHGIIHRDLKPSNVLLEGAEPGNAEQWGTPRITDFGLSHEVDQSVTATAAGTVVGTLAYMAPEQATGKPIGHGADIYSLGVILFEMMTKEKPFWGITDADLLRQLLDSDVPSLRAKRSDIPRDLEGICQKCLAKLPLERYRTAADLANDLKYYLEGQPVAVRPISRLERLGRTIRRHPVVAGLVITSAVLLLAFLVSVLVYEQGLRDSLKREKEHSKTADRERTKAEETAERLTDVHYASTLREATRFLEVGHRTAVIDKLAEALPEAGQADRRDFAWRALRHAAWDAQVTYLSNSNAWVDELILTPDERFLICLSGDRFLRVRDLDTGQVTLLNDNDELIRRVQAVPGSPFSLVTYDQWGSFSRWDWNGKAFTRSIHAPKRSFRSFRKVWPSRVAVSPDGRFYSIIEDEGLILYDSQNDTYAIHKFTEDRSWHQCDLIFSLDSKMVIAVLDGHTSKEHNTNLYFFQLAPFVLKNMDPVKVEMEQCRGLGVSAQRLWYFSDLRLSSIESQTGGLNSNCIVTLSDVSVLGNSNDTPQTPFLFLRSQLLYGGVYGDVVQIDLASFERKRLTKHKTAVYGMLLIGEDEYLSWDLTEVHLIKARTGDIRKIPIPLELQTDRNGFAFLFEGYAVYSETRNTLFLGKYDGRIAALNLDERPKVKEWPHGPDRKEVWAVAYSPDGKILASAGDDQTIQLWNAIDGNLIRTLKGHAELVSSLSFSPDGKLLAACDYHNRAMLWSVENGSLIHTFEEMPGQGWTVTFSHNGKYLATGGKKKGFVYVWDVSTRKRFFSQEEWDGPVFSVQFSSDDSHIYIAGQNQFISEWDLKSGMKLRDFIEADEVYQLHLEKNKLFAVGKSRQISCWDLRDEKDVKLIWRKYDPDAPTWSIAISPDGKTLATSNEKGTIRLWQASTGHELSRMQAGTKRIHSIAFARDGKCLATGSFDGQIRLFWGK